MSDAANRRIRRRKFLIAAAAAVPAGVAVDVCLEPLWVKTRHIRIGKGESTHRIVHFTDLHYRGGERALKRLVSRINACSPEIVCFTGDLIEDEKDLPGALDILSRIKAPLFGVPGNHDYWANLPFDQIEECFASTGGGWLLDQQKASGGIVVTGATCRSESTPIPDPVQGAKNILLMHYPAWVKRMKKKFALVLAGHSHGGQVRVPFYGPIMLSFSVDEYDLGLFETQAGPLYVNPGIGWFAVPFRFNCRPEVTAIDL